MGQRAVVFAELTGAQGENFFNPFNGMAAHVAGEHLIAVDGQALFEAKLKPIATGDAIAGPVVKILMSNDAFDPLKIRVRRGLFRGQNTGRVEHVQPLVFHCPHVEVIDSHNVEYV